KSLLKAPLPDHLIEQLTLKDSETSDYRAPLSIDSETLREYCVALTIALLNNQDLPDQREQMIGMLYELLFVLADDLKAPGFVRVAGRLQMIEGEPVAGVH